ncbi:uncharacterized protein UHOD_12066 [Ustilago sp. UG-2017b]|nr:uncharacterized protein UHOD_12066 [Ustilago sp. UG-2017b]
MQTNPRPSHRERKRLSGGLPFERLIPHGSEARKPTQYPPSEEAEEVGRVSQARKLDQASEARTLVCFGVSNGPDAVQVRCIGQANLKLLDAILRLHYVVTTVQAMVNDAEFVFVSLTNGEAELKQKIEVATRRLHSHRRLAGVRRVEVDKAAQSVETAEKVFTAE